MFFAKFSENLFGFIQALFLCQTIICEMMYIINDFFPGKLKNWHLSTEATLLIFVP